MGRITEFIYYINKKYEPTALEKKSEYSHISFTSETKHQRKEYRKNIKQEENESTS